MTPPFVSLALSVCEKMEICDKSSTGLVMRFCKIYSAEKIWKIVNKAQSFNWWNKYPKAAFMKSVGIINKEEKNGNLDKTL